MRRVYDWGIIKENQVLVAAPSSYIKSAGSLSYCLDSGKHKGALYYVGLSHPHGNLSEHFHIYLFNTHPDVPDYIATIGRYHYLAKLVGTLCQTNIEHTVGIDDHITPGRSHANHPVFYLVLTCGKLNRVETGLICHCTRLYLFDIDNGSLQCLPFQCIKDVSRQGNPFPLSAGHWFPYPEDP